MDVRGSAEKRASGIGREGNKSRGHRIGNPNKEKSLSKQGRLDDFFPNQYVTICVTLKMSKILLLAIFFFFLVRSI